MRYPLGASVAAAVVLVGASLPWVTITGTVEPGLGRVFGVTGTVTGWTGSIAYCGVWVPNWIAVVAAVTSAAGAWLRWFAARNIHPAVPLTVTLGGLLQTLAFLLIAIKSQAGTVGLGAVLTAVGFLGLLIVTVAQSSTWSTKK
jgi:hypothetical protein